jgi:hypothetical protein
MSKRPLIGLAIVGLCLVLAVLLLPHAPASAHGLVLASVVYSSTLKTKRMQLRHRPDRRQDRRGLDRLSGAGKLVIGTSALSGATGVLATIALRQPASPCRAASSPCTACRCRRSPRPAAPRPRPSSATTPTPRSCPA